MEQTKYTPIPPAGMFKVAVTRTVVHDTAIKMHYDPGPCNVPCGYL